MQFVQITLNTVLLMGRSLFISLIFLSKSYSSDYGCQVLLCLANPNGPTAVAACVQPIHQLWDDLEHLRPFPTCDMADGPHGKSYAQQGFNYFDVCPSGTSALDLGLYAVQGTSSSNVQTSTLYTGIGDGTGYTWSSEGNSNNHKICVGQQVSNITVFENSDSAVEAGVYNQVVALDPANSPRIIDVFIDNALYRRVRW